MSSKYSPYGRLFFLTSSISIFFSLRATRFFEAVTRKLDWRPATLNPGARRPCPFDSGNPSTGKRDIRKFFNTPFSTTVTRRAFTPSLSNL
jgi:hypothetical protein